MNSEAATDMSQSSEKDEKGHESQHSIQDTNGKTGDHLDEAACGYSGSTEIYYEPERSSNDSGVRQHSRSDTSGTPNPQRSVTETTSNRDVVMDKDCTSRPARFSNLINRVTTTTDETSAGTSSALKDNRAHDSLVSVASYNTTAKEHSSTVSALGTALCDPQQCRNVYQNTSQRQVTQVYPNYSASKACALTNQAPQLTFTNTLEQGASEMFNAPRQNFRRASEQEIPPKPSVTVSSNPLQSMQTISEESIRAALLKLKEMQYWRTAPHLPRVAQYESPEVPPLNTFLNRAFENTSATSTADQSQMPNSNPILPRVRETTEFILPQGTQSVASELRQQDNPLCLLPPAAHRSNAITRSASHYQTSSFSTPSGAVQRNQDGQHQTSNLMTPSGTHQYNFNAPQINVPTPPDYRELNPDRGSVSVARSHIPVTTASGWQPVLSGLSDPLGRLYAERNNHFFESPPPGYRIAFPQRDDTSAVRQMLLPDVPLLQTVTQVRQMPHASHLTSQRQVAPTSFSEADPRASQYIAHCVSASPATQPTTQPTFPPMMGVPQAEPSSGGGRPHSVLYEEPVPFLEKMMYVQKWVNESNAPDPQEMSHSSRGQRRHQRGAKSRKGLSGAQGSEVVLNNDKRNTEADATGTTAAVGNFAQNVSAELLQERTPHESTMTGSRFEQEAHNLPSIERTIPGSHSQIRSASTRGTMAGRRRGRQRRGSTRGSWQVQNPAGKQGGPGVSQQPYSVESSQSLHGKEHNLHSIEGAPSFSDLGRATTFHTSAQAHPSIKKTSRINILESNPNESPHQHRVSQSSSMLSSTKTFKYPCALEAVEEQEQEEEMMRQDQSDSQRVAKPDSSCRHRYSREPNEPHDLIRETQRSSVSSETFNKECSAKSAEGTSPLTRAGGSKLTLRTKRPSREPQNLLQQQKPPMLAQRKTSTKAQDSVVHETEDLHHERGTCEDESSSE